MSRLNNVQVEHHLLVTGTTNLVWINDNRLARGNLFSDHTIWKDPFQRGDTIKEARGF